jgi:GNAT superfamily N-acetyltransferase
VIRHARPEESEQLRTIERASGQRFLDVGMAVVAAAEPVAAEDLATYAAADRAWVAVDDGDRPVGFVIVDIVDGCAHIEQISVQPDHQGRGLARFLLNEVERWAIGEGMTDMTLATFAEVPWNRPLYEHLGFTVLPEAQLSPGLRAIRANEAAQGLDPALRVCMRREVNRDRPGEGVM